MIKITGISILLLNSFYIEAKISNEKIYHKKKFFYEIIKDGYFNTPSSNLPFINNFFYRNTLIPKTNIILKSKGKLSYYSNLPVLRINDKTKGAIFGEQGIHSLGQGFLPNFLLEKKSDVHVLYGKEKFDTKLEITGNYSRNYYAKNFKIKINGTKYKLKPFYNEESRYSLVLINHFLKQRGYSYYTFNFVQLFLNNEFWGVYLMRKDLPKKNKMHPHKIAFFETLPIERVHFLQTVRLHRAY